jgi:hypothetical protein
VEIEGLRYRILHDKRARRRAAILPAGRHPVEAAARLSAGEQVEGMTWAWEFAHAAWAELLQVLLASGGQHGSLPWRYGDAYDGTGRR